MYGYRSNYGYAGGYAISGGAPAAFSPADIEGLVWWLPAESVTGLDDGEAVALWPDVSPAEVDLVQASEAAQPTFQTNESNGKPAIRFNGIAQWLATTSRAALAEWTVFIVAKNANATAAYIFDTGAGVTGGANSIISNFVAGKDEYYQTPRTVLGDVTTETFRLIVNTAGSAALGGWTLGGAAGGINLWAGDIAEVVVYDRVLEAGEISQVSAYLTAEHDL